MAFNLFDIKISHKINKQNMPPSLKSNTPETGITPNRIILLKKNIKQISHLIFYNLLMK
ncbi:MAG: hypothetical protein ACTS77_00655 [Arsenophonus sp. NC-TX2-MAG3]